jgi:hypothetical protein
MAAAPFQSIFLILSHNREEGYLFAKKDGLSEGKTVFGVRIA